MSLCNFEPYRPKGKVEDELFDMWAAEAVFGWRETSPFIQTGLRGLEIGGGTGLLAAKMSETLEDVTLIEPVSNTFSKSETVLEIIRSNGPSNLTIKRQTLESFEDASGFDLIWSINVFEHLEDWKTALLTTRSLLRPGGQAVILCPNYNIPYESHFGLPVLGSKKITQKIFASKIKLFEERHSCPGLWDSLNFIHASQIIGFAKRNNLRIHIDKTITRRLFQRFSTDPQLLKRHKRLGTLIKLAQTFGLPKLWSQLPARYQPYTALHIYAEGKI